jgi:hypothetical protein
MGDILSLGAPGDITVRLQLESYARLTRVALYGATGTHHEFSPPTWTSVLDTTLIVPLAHDDFVVLDVEAAPEDWPGLQFAPRAISSPVWIDTATPWPLDATLVRDKVNELAAFWQQALRDRGFATSTDSAAAWEHIGGAAVAYEALVDDPPAAFELVAPSPDEGFSAPPVILRWSSSLSYDGEPLSYHLQVGRDPGFVDLVLDEVLGDTLRVLTDLEGPASYHWQVEALEPEDPPVLAGGAPRSFLLTGGVVDAPAAATGTDPLVLARLGTHSGGLRLRLSLRWAMPVQLRWFDARGREIGSQDLGEVDAGTHTLELPARDQRGVPLARGVYWLSAQSGPHRDVTRVLWTR